MSERFVPRVLLLLGLLCSGCASPLVERLVLVPWDSAQTCEEVTLELMASSGARDDLVYSWAVINAPAGALFKLVTAGSVARFVAATPTTYQVGVRVTDEKHRSAMLPVRVRIDEGDDLGCLDREQVESWRSKQLRRRSCRF